MEKFHFTLTTRKLNGEPAYWNFEDTDDEFLNTQVEAVLRAAGFDKQEWMDGKVDLSLTTRTPRPEDTPYS